MCGIFFYLGNYLTEEQLIQAFKTMAHRGPDETVPPHSVGLFNAADGSTLNVVFGFHRLSINGLDAASGQPMSHNGVTLICNGEIYNHLELATKYGFELKTKSDCEVILHMYSKFGIERTLQELEGVFALVIYDSVSNKLFIGRDPVGVRPCFIARDHKGGVLVASEEKALFTCANKDSVQHVHGSTYIEVRLWKSDPVICTLEEHQYIDLTAGPTSDTECLDDKPSEILFKLVSHAVDVRASMADRPVGVFLSGGLDSSGVAAIAKKKIPKLRSFSIALKDSVSSDLINARKVAAALDLDHTEVFFTVEEGILAITELIYILGTCDTTTIRASLPMYLLSKYIKQHTDIVVMLSGEGPDEVMSGYLYNHNAPSLDALHNEAVWRTFEMIKFDIKRADHATAAWSLEVRVPYLCKHIISYVFSLDPALRDPKSNGGVEKFLLRKALTGLLPDEILWRPKEAFSDGVGYSWVNGIREYAERTVPVERWELREILYPEMTPPTKEAFMYREIYEKYYNRTNPPLVDYYWLPKWSGDHGGDPSARVLDIHKTLITSTCNSS